MLLQLQKPGMSCAASARDWQVRFGRFAGENRPYWLPWSIRKEQ
jgi:hypothetical protein